MNYVHRRSSDDKQIENYHECGYRMNKPKNQNQWYKGGVLVGNGISKCKNKDDIEHSTDFPH